MDKMQKSVEKWMQEVLDNPPDGLMFGDNKATGKTYMEKLLVAFGDEIKTFLKMECL